MKLKSLLILFLLPFLSCSQSKQKIKPTNNSVKVLELFTSEGCSSCPPADKLVEELQNKNLDNVIILAYHVDYWDRLGWKDTFSQKKFSQRQSWYSSIFKLNSDYTPQIIVNGQKEFVGSERNSLNNALENKNLASSESGIKIKILNSDKETVSVEYNLENVNPDENLNFALVQNHATTQVKRSENSNRKLSHVDVVREFETTPAEKSGNIDLKSDNLIGKEFHIVAFLQNKKTGKISEVKTKTL